MKAWSGRWKYPVYIGLALVAAAIVRTRTKCALPDRQIRVAIAVAAIPVCLFFYLQNFYQPRLLWNITALIVVFNTVLLRDVSHLTPRWCKLFSRIAMAAFALVRFG